MASVIGQICYLMKNNRASLEYFVFLDCILLLKYINNILLTCIIYIYISYTIAILFISKKNISIIFSKQLVQKHYFFFKQ